MAKYSFGVDVGGTTIKMGLFDTAQIMARLRPGLMGMLWHTSLLPRYSVY